MSSYPQRQPPRFVPTLTQVVADEPVTPSAELPAASVELRAGAGAIPVHTAQLQQLEEKLMAQVQSIIETRIAALVHKQLPVLMGTVATEMLQDLRPIVQQALQDIDK